MKDARDLLATQFETHRTRLRSVAYRMLGSLNEADDAIQETWLRLSGSDASAIGNLGGWLTTVVARVCLDMLRSRQTRREEPLESTPFEFAVRAEGERDPEHEALLAESVGLALLVVLDTLNPMERSAFVLHDMFDLSFEEIAGILGRSPPAARQLASRARRRVRGTANVRDAHFGNQRDVVETFIAALRNGDIQGLLAVLDPDLVVSADDAAARRGAPKEVRGAQTWVKGAVAFSKAMQVAQPMLIDGAVGLVLAPKGHLFRALTFTLAHGKIGAIEVIADPGRLRQLKLAVLPPA